MAKTNRRKHKRKKSSTIPLLIIGAGLVLIAVVLSIYLTRDQDDVQASAGGGEALANGMPSAIPAQVEFEAPELSLQSVSGDKESLADYRGQVVLVNNWATWCPPCTAEMPELQAFYEAHAADGLVIIAVEAGDPKSQVAAFVEENGLTFPVWLDPWQDSIDAFRNPSLPNSFVIDEEGTIRLAWTGAISQGMLERYVTPLLHD